MSKQAKVLVYDIETAPIIGTTWGKYEQNLIWSIQDWYILGFSYRWNGVKMKTQSVFMPDFKLYKKDPTSDLEVVKVLHKLFDEADIVVAHNGNSFDQKKSQARMIIHGFKPPSPYLQIDTKLVARRNFNFTSNKLDDLGEYFGFGNKLKTDYSLWKKCMAGDMKAWKYMRTYCDRDVELLEKVYIKMRPWDKSHPNMSTITEQPDVCRVCGKNEGFVDNGYNYSRVGTYKRWKCKVVGCYANNTSRTPEKQSKEERTKYV